MLNSSTTSSSSSYPSTNSNNKRKYPWLSSPRQEEALKPEGTIRLEIENFAKFGQSRATTETRAGPERHSEPVFIRGLAWKLSAGIKKSDKGEKVLHCYVVWDSGSNNEDTDYGWVSMSGEIRLLAQKEDKEGIVKPFKNHYSSSSDKQGFGHMESIENIMKPENGWYDPECDTVILEAAVRSSLPCGLKMDRNKLMITTREVKRSEAFKIRMKNMLGAGKGCDVEFLVGINEELLAAHKLFLISVSPKFEELFNNRNGDKPLKVPDMDAGAFRVMFNYIYTGDPEGLDWDNLLAVFKAAKRFQVSGLRQICTNWFFDVDINKDSVLNILEQARLCEANSLEHFVARCWRFIDQNVYAVVGSQSFLRIDNKLLEELLARDTLAMSKKSEGEIALWNAAIRWADEQCRQKGLVCYGETRRQMLGTALFKIRMPLIDRNILKEKIVPSGVLTKDEITNLVLCQLNPDPQAFVDSVRMFGLEDQFHLKFPTGKRA